MARGPERRLVTLVVDPHAEEPADVIGDEPIWHDGQVVGWVTSGAYADHSGLSLALGYVPAALAEPGAASSDHGGFEVEIIGHRCPPACSPSRRSTPRACGCARDDPGAGRRTAGVLGRRHGRARRPAGRAAPRPRRDAVPGRRLRELRRRGRRRGLRPHVPDPGARRHGRAPRTRRSAGRRCSARGGRPRPDRAGRAPPAGALGAPRIGRRRRGRPGRERPGRARRAPSRGSGRARARRRARPGGRDRRPRPDARRAGDGRRRAGRDRARPRPRGRAGHRRGRAAARLPRQPPAGAPHRVGRRHRATRRASSCPTRSRWATCPMACRSARWPGSSSASTAMPTAPCRPRCSTTTASSRPTRAGPSWSASARRRATSWPASPPTAACASSVPPRRSTPCRRRPSTASSARAPGPRSRTSTACGTAASGSWSWSSGPASAAPAPARGPCACPTCGPTWPTARAPSPPRSRPGRRRASSRWPRRPRAATSTPSAARRSTTSTSAWARRLDRFGGWWRPWTYGDLRAEYDAVRQGVSVGDVSTLGKMVVSGPDVVEALERLYPNHVHDIRPGRARYVLLLNERGHIIDDGMICRDDETRFTLTFTSGGASAAEMWVRDWLETWGLRVHVLDRTMALGAINVTGTARPAPRPARRRRPAPLPPAPPPARRGDRLPPHAALVHRVRPASSCTTASTPRSSCGRPCSKPERTSASRPHGLQALFGLRLEKGHIIVGQDTELDTSPRRVGMDWAVKMDKPDFLGRRSLERTADLPDERRLLGFTMPGPAPVEGSVILSGGEVVGAVTSSFDSPVLGHAVLLGWLRRRPAPGDRVGRPADRGHRRTDGDRGRDPVLRPEWGPCPRLSRSAAGASWPGPRPWTRCAAGRPRHGPAAGHRRPAADRARRSTSGRRRRRHRRARRRLRGLDARCRGAAVARGGARGLGAPGRRPALAQGLIAAVPAKLWLEGRRHGPADLPRRLRRELGAGAPGADGMNEFVETLLDVRFAEPKRVLRRRHHRRRRPRPVDRLPPRRPPRDHERGRPRAGLHRLGQLRSQHHHHQGQLRPAGGRALLPAQPGALPAPGGRDRLRRHARQQGHPLAGPLHHHRPDRAGARPPQHGLRREDQLRRARGDRDHLPRDRPRRRRPLPGARRVVTTRRRPRPGTTASSGPTRRARPAAASTSCRTRRSPG